MRALRLLPLAALLGALAGCTLAPRDEPPTPTTSLAPPAAPPAAPTVAEEPDAPAPPTYEGLRVTLTLDNDTLPPNGSILVRGVIRNEGNLTVFLTAACAPPVRFTLVDAEGVRRPLASHKTCFAWHAQPFPPGAEAARELSWDGRWTLAQGNPMPRAPPGAHTLVAHVEYALDPEAPEPTHRASDEARVRVE